MEEQVRKAVFLNRETFGSQFALAISRIPYSVVKEYTSTGLEELFADVGTWKKQTITLETLTLDEMSFDVNSGIY
uniref:Uncharacterized protein n=1 Tax=Oryza meridionalis TaxID=40149 RepID=A0A0E0DHG5_9ORYZ